MGNVLPLQPAILRTVLTSIVFRGSKPKLPRSERSIPRTATNEEVTSKAQMAICTTSRTSRIVKRRSPATPALPVRITCHGSERITCRTGTIPNSNGVRARVSYTVFAGLPFILESSAMEFTTNTEVNAVRHNELVFSRGIHTHTAWMDEKGETTVRRLYDPQEPFHFYGTVMETGPDVPWVALLNDQKKYGIAVVNLARLDSAPGVAAVPDGDARYYALDYSEWGTAENFDMNFAYICRPLVYRHTIVPKGAVFAEDSAFLPFKIGDGKHQLDSLKDWAAMLRKPLVVDVR